MTTTELSREQLERLATFAQSVVLVELRPTGFEAKLDAEWPSEQDAPQITVNVSHELGVLLGPEQESAPFRVDGDFKCVVHRPSAPRDTYAHFAWSARAVYLVPGAKSLQGQEELVSQYANVNTMVHLWPYFRAFVQTSCAQLLIRPIVLPPTNFGKRVGNPLGQPTAKGRPTPRGRG
jgi:hypothetical protein